MNAKYIAFAALGISIVALGISIKALDETNTTNSLLGEFLKAKSKNFFEDDEEVNTRLDDYIKEEEESIKEDSDLDIEDLDNTVEGEEDIKPVDNIESTGGIEYVEEPVNE